MTNMLNNVSVYIENTKEDLRAHIVYYDLFITFHPQDIFFFSLSIEIQCLSSLHNCS